MNTNKFKYKQGDYDYVSLERKLKGRITKNRRKSIERMVRVYNHTWKAPYGLSPNGYPYTCGCSHDCCGCISSKGASVVFETINSVETATINIFESYNY